MGGWFCLDFLDIDEEGEGCFGNRMTDQSMLVFFALENLVNPIRS